MEPKGTISSQLRRQREVLGLSMAEVARRAGTSVASLSRYESGWSRFEVYTLKKLASALGCEVDITLRPVQSVRPVPVDRAEAVHRLKRLFWDHDLTPDDLESCPVWVAERVLDYGQLEDIHLLRGVLGPDAFLRIVAASVNRLSPRTRALWLQLLDMEGVPCTKACFRDTAWNY